MNTDLIAVTLIQPWASLIVAGGLGWNEYKDIENRDWYCNHRGLLLIHAGVNKRFMRFREDEEEYDELSEGSGLPDIDDLPLGAIVGAVEMVDCYKSNPKKKRSRWEQGTWCWKLVNPIYFENPIKHRGQLGLWVPERQTWQSILDQLRKS